MYLSACVFFHLFLIEEFYRLPIISMCTDLNVQLLSNTKSVWLTRREEDTPSVTSAGGGAADALPWQQQVARSFSAEYFC